MNTGIDQLKARKKLNLDHSGTALTLGLLLALQAVAGPGMAYAVAGTSPSGRSEAEGRAQAENSESLRSESSRSVEAQTLRGHTSYVYSAAFSPDGQTIVTGSHDDTAKIWKLEGSAQP